MDTHISLVVPRPTPLMERWGNKSGLQFLLDDENWDTFLERIIGIFPEVDYRHDVINDAYLCSKEALRKIIRESGVRYFEHVRCVALIVMDYLGVRDHTLIAAALLHDIVEDSPWTTWRIMREFGVYIAFLVWLLTKPRGELGKWFYHFRFHFAPREFFVVKLADRFHNLITLEYMPRDRQIAKIEETEKYYLPYAKKYGILFDELTEILSDLKQTLGMDEPDAGSSCQ